MGFWEKVNSVEDLKSLSVSDLSVYADEVREHVISTVKSNGGHLSSNLGAVELTIALHYVFDSPTDKILWDVGHQSYTHKIITGRRDAFSTLRRLDGIAGFPNKNESVHDPVTTGHSSNSLSIALGLARARDFAGENYKVVSVIGDGALTGGMAYEAMNDIGASGVPMLIILNDNKMSISRNVGALTKYLTKLRLSKRYKNVKYTLKKGISAMPFFGDRLVRALEKAKDDAKSTLLANKLFESLGIKYLGPFDGHNLQEIISVFRRVKNENKPILVHLVTSKGKGYPDAESDPEKYHGVSPSGETGGVRSFTDRFSEEICNLAQTDDKVVAITAAMTSGTGLDAFAKKYPDRFFDVGIAEQHAVSMAAGLALGGYKPYVAIYSSFLQRGFDQLLHDVGMNRLPIRFIIDRAGAIGQDGVTHQGVFDLGYIGMIPSFTLLTPKDADELSAMLRFSLSYDGPIAIRYPKSYYLEFGKTEFDLKWEYLRRANSNVYILACGSRALTAAFDLTDYNLINARCIKPLDGDLLRTINKSGNIIVTVEDNVLRGGFGESVIAELNRSGMKAGVVSAGYPDEYLACNDAGATLDYGNVSKAGIEKLIDRAKSAK